MTNLFLNKILLLNLFLIINIGILFADDPAPTEKKEDEDDWKKSEYVESTKHKYLKEVYEMTLNHPFEDVFRATITSIEADHCLIMSKNTRQTDDGLYLGNIKSDYCLFAAGDTTLENLKYYSVDLPFIRGGVWKTGRMQYKFQLKELADGNTYIKVAGEISGHETLVTKKVHFWQSNGYLETMILERVKKILEGNQ